MKTVFLRCILCGIQVSKILSPLADLAPLCEKDGQPLFPARRYLMSSAFLDAGTTRDSITRDEILLNGGDILNSQPGGTRNGC